MAENSAPVNAVRSRYQLLLLMLMPIGVVLLATFVFYTRIGMPEGTRNKGTLIVPPVQVNDLGLRDEQGNPVRLESTKPQVWIFLIAHPAVCDEACRKEFWEVRQTHIALGKYQNNIRRVWLVTEGQIDAGTREWLATEQPGWQLLYVQPGQWQQLLQQSVEGAASLQKARFHLVDPRGFVMMYYDAGDTYKDVITDMKFLLKGVE